MKAVVMKIKNKKAIILKNDGSFISVPNRNYSVGQVLKLKDTNSNNTISIKLIRVAAAAACLLFIFGGAVFAYNSPQSYVSIDINPSIELEINMFNRVISANGVNDDGTAVLENLEIKNKSMEIALEMIMCQLDADGYINENQAKAVVVAVHCSNHEKEKKVMESAELQISKSLNILEVSTTVSVKSIKVGTIIEAQSMGTTGGKLDLAEEYIQVTGDESQVEEIVNIPVNVLKEAIEKANSDNQGKSPDHAKDNDQDSSDDVDEDSEDKSNTENKSDNHNKNDDDDDDEKEDKKDSASESSDDRSDDVDESQGKSDKNDDIDIEDDSTEDDSENDD